MSRPSHQTLVIFAKAPQLGAVKTRLASSIGEGAAQRIYSALARRTITRLSGAPHWRTIVATTPANLQGHRMFRQPSVTVRDQGMGDLGERMARALCFPDAGATVLVGTDIPELDGTKVADAFRLLSAHDAVFGPAVDGGYWLVGLRRRSLAHAMFRRVRWSTEHALEDTLKNLSGANIGFLPTLRDLDDAADLAMSDLA